MSTAAKGAQRVGSIMTQLSSLGYRCARVSASGQRKGWRKDERGVAGDVIALAPIDGGLPHLILEVGAAGKRVSAALAELLEYPLPGGFSALVARCVGRRWHFYTGPHRDDSFTSLDDALDALRNR